MSARDRYRLIITPSSRRHLAERLPHSVAFAVHEFVTGPLLENPRRMGKRLRQPAEAEFSARRGTYRVLYDIDEDAHEVIVVAVSHRSHVDRRR